MKKLLCIILVLACAIGLFSCKEAPATETSESTQPPETQHVCSFSTQVATDRYLKSEATCEKQATYY